MRILGLIPARGGSKGLPGKNIKKLAGKPLIQRTLECAQESGVVDRIVLSTDDEEIAAIARGFGTDVPFMRPDELAADNTPMIDVAVHAIETLKEQEYEADALLLLQATSPFRTPDHIRKAVSLLGNNDSVCSVVALPKGNCPHYLMKITDDGHLDFFMPNGAEITRRQDVPQAYKRDGTIFLTRSDVIWHDRTFYGATCVPMLLGAGECLSIDTQTDWIEAERRMGV